LFLLLSTSDLVWWCANCAGQGSRLDIIVRRRMFKFCLIGLLDQLQDHEYFHKQSLNRKQVFNFCVNGLVWTGWTSTYTGALTSLIEAS
jgi:hypothetical protein